MPEPLDYFTPPPRPSPLRLVGVILLNTAVAALLLWVLVMFLKPGVNQ